VTISAHLQNKIIITQLTFMKLSTTKTHVHTHANTDLQLNSLTSDFKTNKRVKI